MGHITKAMLRACTGLAMTAAVVAGGAAAASAATDNPATHNFPGQNCSPFALEHWNVTSNTNQVVAIYQGTTFKYSVKLKQNGSCLSGTLTDSGVAPHGLTAPIWGTVTKNHITINFSYGSGSVQGTRTFYGNISWKGAVSGWWNETGSEHGTGTWTLADNAHLACPGPAVWWNQNSACPVPLPPPPHHHHHHI
jgi:hypothetical protein